MNRNVFLSLLALDSYNRDYNVGLELNGDELGNAQVIDVINVIGQSKYLEWQAAGFYASAYNWNGETIISFRGTDNIEIFAQASDLWRGWAIGGGFTEPDQAGLAINFYEAVHNVGSASMEAPPVIVPTYRHSMDLNPDRMISPLQDIDRTVLLMLQDTASFAPARGDLEGRDRISDTRMIEWYA